MATTKPTCYCGIILAPNELVGRPCTHMQAFADIVNAAVAARRASGK